MAVLLLVFGFVAIIALLSILRGFVLSYLWHWFVVPLGVMELSIPHAIGIAALVGFLTYQYSANDEEKGSITKLVVAVVMMPFTFIIGYIVHSFM